jgi:hypothetical protein
MKTIAVLIALAGLNSCTLTIAPDGSKSATVDGVALARALEIYATK